MRSGGLALLRTAVLAALAVAWIAAAHLGSAGLVDPDFSAALALAPAAAAVPLLLWRAGRRAVAAAGTLCLIGLVAAVWPVLRGNVALLYFLQHLGVNLALAALFGRSLLAGREPLISRLSRAVHGGAMTDARARYTRGVTVAWTAFFLASAVVSAALFLLAAPAVWSFFANVLTGPLIAIAYLAEYAVRCRTLPPGDRTRFADALRAYRASPR
jgi:uncharacterized membrane protein